MHIVKITGAQGAGSLKLSVIWLNCTNPPDGHLLRGPETAELFNSFGRL